MRLAGVLVAILVAIGAAGVAFYLAGAQTAELEKKVAVLEENLVRAREDINQAGQEIAKADTSRLQEDVNTLSDALWAKVAELNKKDAQLEAQVERLACVPAGPPAGPGPAGSLDEPLSSEPGAGGDPAVEQLTRGAARLVRGFQDRMLNRQMETYKKELNLTDSQAESLKKTLSEQTAKLMEDVGKVLREGGGNADRTAVFEEFTKQRDEMLQQILSPEQLQKFKELEQSQGQRLMGPRGMGQRGPRGGQQGQPEGGAPAPPAPEGQK